MMFTWHNRLLPALILILSCLFMEEVRASTPVSEAPRDAEEAYEWSDAVFLGRVIEVNTDDQGFDSLATVQVSQVWKGKDFPPQVLVDGSGGATYPARIFKQDQVCLFYVDYASASNSDRYLDRKEVEEASYPGGWLRADSHLHRVLPIQEATNDLEFLLPVPTYQTQEE